MRAPRAISVILRLLLVLTISAPFIFLLLALQTERKVEISAALSPGELEQIEQLLLDSAPASTTQVSRQNIDFTTDEMDLLVRYGMQLMNLTPAWSSSVTLESELLITNTSIAMGGANSPVFLNIESVFSASAEGLVLEQLQLGQVNLPGPIRNFAMARVRSNLLATNVGFQEFDELAGNIDSLRIESDRLHLTVAWQPDLIDRIASRTRQLFVPESDRQRIIAYYEEIRNIVTTIPTDLRAVSLNTFLVPLFSEALDQSQSGGDPIAENRALLQALAIYVNDENIQQLLGPEWTEGVAPVNFIEVRLQRRQDLAQHLSSIAATTSSAGAGFAQLLSTTKEAYDARYASGFSFSDLTANTVGVTLGTLATESQESALELQKRISEIENESDYMPSAGNNRDGLSEADFATIYRDRNSPEYEQRILEIQRMIADRPLFQNF